MRRCSWAVQLERGGEGTEGRGGRYAAERMRLPCAGGLLPPVCGVNQKSLLPKKSQGAGRGDESNRRMPNRRPKKKKKKKKKKKERL
jgi:hypothetical protein